MVSEKSLTKRDPVADSQFIAKAGMNAIPSSYQEVMRSRIPLRNPGKSSQTRGIRLLLMLATHAQDDPLCPIEFEMLPKIKFNLLAKTLEVYSVGNIMNMLWLDAEFFHQPARN